MKIKFYNFNYFTSFTLFQKSFTITICIDKKAKYQTKKERWNHSFILFMLAFLIDTKFHFSILFVLFLHNVVYFDNCYSVCLFENL